MMGALGMAADPGLAHRLGLSEYSNCRALWACVLQVAISDLHDPHNWQQARDWFLDEQGFDNGFREICDRLDWDGDAILQVLGKKLYEKPEHFTPTILRRRWWGR